MDPNMSALMDQSPDASKPSGIPRPSRLPVRNATLRQAASRDNLQQPGRLNIVNPRLRNAPSREHLSSSTPTKPRLPATPPRSREPSATFQRDVSGSIGRSQSTRQPLRKPSRESLFRQPSKSFLRESLLWPEPVEEDQGSQERSAAPTEESHLARSIRKPRPSLAERTVETLQSVPPSPAMRKRNSSFFRSESPMRPPSSGGPLSRPGSSHDPSMRPPSRSVSSRPTSSSSFAVPPDLRAPANTFKPPPSTTHVHTPLKRLSMAKPGKVPSSIRTGLPFAGNSVSKLPSPSFSSTAHERSPSPAKASTNLSALKSGSKTFSARPLKPRASINGLFRKPSLQALNQDGDADKIGLAFKNNSVPRSRTPSENILPEDASTLSKLSKGSIAHTSPGDDKDASPRKSSMALRDQIAKAKAAKRAAAAKLSALPSLGSGDEVPVIASGTFDFGLPEDPFNQNVGQDGSKGLLKKRIASARTDGRLNIAAMGLKEMPEEVMNMYSLEAAGTHGGSWAESVDLTRLVAADNEFEILSDDIFPDVDPRANTDNDDAPGNQFGGLETLDLHGNILGALPLGLRRLELLTTLNLCNNKLGNDCFEILSQISSLRDLKVAGNQLSGPVPAKISSLTKLERLELQRNGLTSVPEELKAISRLRILNVSENKINSLPFEALSQLPLAEIWAAKNSLSGALITAEVTELPQLQILDVTCNALTSLDISGSLKLPSLHQLSCSANQISGLPDLTSWTALLNIAAEDNHISILPKGFVTLPKIKSVDFSGNDLKILDDEIGGMESLVVFRISGNPLREKKFSGMSTDDLKHALKARMAPVEPPVLEKESEADGSFYSAPVSPVSSRPTSSHWPVRLGGVLDRSNTNSHSLNPVTAADVAANNVIKILELHHNIFKEIPSSIEFFALTLTTLSIAHNELDGERFMKDDLELPVLKDLNLSSNTLITLQPLIQHLKAPLLERLDISFNRLITLPPLKKHFPSLITLLASNNTIRELNPESVKGLRTLDCSSNDINSLNARIGLLGGPGGLERLDVRGNRFRVPKYTILDKGTEATLAWLKDRIPAEDSTVVETE